MSSVLYYSNYCDKCKNIIRSLGNSETKNEIHFVCIDKRFRDEKNGATYVILENQQRIILPPQIQRVPALLLLREGNKVLFGNEINDKLAPKNDFKNAQATGFNGEPSAFALGNDNTNGFGVASDNYSFWDQDSEELMAKGNGGTRQMYNYASVNQSSNIETPPDTWQPDKVEEGSLKQMEEERNKDLRMQQQNRPPGA